MRCLSKSAIRAYPVLIFVLVGVPRGAYGQTCGTADTREPSAARAALTAAEQDASTAMVEMGLGETLPGIIGDSSTILLANAPVLRGRESITRVLAQSGYRRSRQRWQPLRVLVSRDGRWGATFGISIIEGSGGRPSNLGRYITAWQCDAQNSWQAVAHVDLRPTNPAIQVPPDVTSAARESPRDAFARADLEFAKLAADSGAAVAFGRYAAPDAIMFTPSGEISIGPASIRARLADGRSGAQWRWRPLFSYVAATNDLGTTVGEAEIRAPGSAPVYSKYLTVWQRQPDGSLKFVVDAGNPRPAIAQNPGTSPPQSSPHRSNPR